MALLALLGCSTIGGWDTDPPAGTAVSGPRVVVSPGTLEFDTVSVNGAGTRTDFMTLSNIGDAEETVTGHDEPLGSSAFHVDAEPILTLGAGESITVAITYAPLTEQSDSAEILVEPTGETVRLTGTGTAPVLVLDAPVVDDVAVGCTGTGSVAVTNTGSETLTLLGAEVDDAEFAITALPDTVGPGRTETIALAFTPAGGDARGATLLLSSDDPLHPELGVALSGLGYEGERVTETFRYTPSNPTDLLFVTAIGGMSGQADKAAEVIPDFVDTLRDTNIDYHLAALSGSGPCPSSSPGWVDRSDTSLQAEAILEHGLVGESGSWDDDLLGLAAEALGNSETGGCLDGFRREDADLHLVVLSGGPSATDPGEIAALIAEEVAAPAQLRVSALLPLGGGCGRAAANYAAVVETYDGTLADLCAEDWSDAFDAFADLPSGRSAVRYALAEVPVESTIEVLAEGATFTQWSWDAVGNAVVFDHEQVPALGAEITVRYVSSVTCQ